MNFVVASMHNILELISMLPQPQSRGYEDVHGGNPNKGMTLKIELIRQRMVALMKYCGLLY